MLITMDSTLVTLDSTTAFTWDQDVVAGFGFVTITTASSTTISFVGDARAEAIQFDRQMLRNPYGTSWFQSGSGTLGPQLIRVTGEVWSTASDGITSAFTTVEAVRAAAEDAVLVEVSWGTFDILALQSFARSPIEAGYRVDMVFVTESGRN
jgi:hypothetical protein